MLSRRNGALVGSVQCTHHSKNKRLALVQLSDVDRHGHGPLRSLCRMLEPAASVLELLRRVALGAACTPVRSGHVDGAGNLVKDGVHLVYLEVTVQASGRVGIVDLLAIVLKLNFLEVVPAAVRRVLRGSKLLVRGLIVAPVTTVDVFCEVRSAVE